jgi:heme-degrading monooxygenase HmoA
MPFILVRHTVADFATWNPAYDEHATMRKDAGSKGGQVLRSADNPQEVVVLLEWDNLQNAQAFAGSAGLQAAMEKAGVVGQPDILFLEEVERSEA